MSTGRASAARRASTPSGLVRRRMAPDMAAAGMRLACRASATVPAASAMRACAARVMATSCGGDSGVRCRSMTTPPSSRASCEPRRTALASAAAPACSQARAIRRSWRSRTTRAPAAAATRRRGSRLSSRSQAGSVPAGGRLPTPACTWPYAGGANVSGAVVPSSRSSAVWNGTRAVSGHAGGSPGPGGRSALCTPITPPPGRPPAAAPRSRFGGRDVVSSSGAGCNRRTSVSKLPSRPVANSQES